MHLKICGKEKEELGCEKGAGPLAIIGAIYNLVGVEREREYYLLKFPASFSLSKDVADEKH